MATHAYAPPVVRCTCSCGAVWTRDSWPSLTPVGTWPTGGAVLELRVCTCGSTISAQVSPTSTTIEVVRKR